MALTEPICHIAGMAAVFSHSIAIYFECFATMLTDERLPRFAPNIVRLCVPPLHPTRVRAEFFLLTPWILQHWLAAGLTEMLWQRLVRVTCQPIPAAKRFDGILRYA